MKFETHNEKEINPVGTSLWGYINISYQDIVEKLGNPTKSDGYKVDAEWIIRFEDGAVATIYNYKDGKNYLGRRGKSVEKITDWHIGGKDNTVVAKVWKIFGMQ